MNTQLPSITFTLETITPTEAQRILAEHDAAIERGKIVNRSRTVGAIRRYAADMKAELWYAETAETLKFETLEKLLKGEHLIDGQNRLAACVEANTPFGVYIARGVAREAYASIDSGVNRTLKHTLENRQERDADVLSKALKWIGQWDWRAGRLGSTYGQGISTHRALRLLESDPAIRTSVAVAIPVKQGKLISAGLAAFLHRVFSKYDALLANAFIESIVTGANLVAGDPFLLFREGLIRNKDQRRKLPQRDIVALAIKAWLAKRESRILKKLVYIHGREEPALEAGETQNTTKLEHKNGVDIGPEEIQTNETTEIDTAADSSTDAAGAQQ